MIQQWLALGGATVSLIVNTYAFRVVSRDIELRNLRRLFGINAALSLMYVGSFVVLLFGVDQGEWSRTLLWATPLAFLGPWCMPALTILVYAAGKANRNDIAHGNDNASTPDRNDG